MFDKSFLVNGVVESLLEREFDVFISHGCFDIAAKRKRLMLVKALINIDGLISHQAFSLRAISYFLSAYPFVVSMKNNRGFLSDKIIYSRFDLPVVTPEMFDDILEEEAYSVHSAKGRHSVKIDAKALRKKRKEMEFTLKELSKLVGISKKALYEIEKRRVNPKVETVKRLELILNEDLKKTYEPEKAKATYLKPRDPFQEKVGREFNRIGIDNSPIYSAPFELVGREKFSLITGLSENSRKIKRNASSIKKLSAISSSCAFFVTKKSKEESVDGVPILLESELPDVDSPRELNKLIREKI